MSLALRIGRVRLGDRFAYCVMQGNARLSRAVATFEEARRDEIKIRADYRETAPEEVQRRCLCCGGVVWSTGPHERLCKTCRPKSQLRPV